MLLKQLKYFISIVEKENFTEAPIEAILKVDLYGTAVLLEEVGKVIKKAGMVVQQRHITMERCVKNNSG